MEPEELDQMDEDDFEEVKIVEGADVVVPESVAGIAQLAAEWAVEMAAQLDGFLIEEVELAEAIEEVAVLTTGSQVAEDDDDGIMLEDLDIELEEKPPD